MIRSSRLELRNWEDGDVATIHAMMQCPDVNYYLQRHHLDKIETIEAIAKKAMTNIAEKGFGYFICQDRETKEVYGLAGLNYVELAIDHFPCYTISGIGRKDQWGKGYATEVASALFQYASEVLKLSKVFACTTSNNEKSVKAMERLGMEFVQNFDFPGFDKEDIFCEHKLYVKVLGQ